MRVADLRQITAICFDADQTLWDFSKVMRHALACVLDELERRLPAARGLLSVDRMIAIRNATGEESMRGAWTHEAIRLEAFKRTLAYIGNHDDALATELNGLFFKHRYEDIELYADVLPALDFLRGRYKLGLMTNGNTYPERCGLPDNFQFVVIGQDYGLQKPDPRLFEIALQKARCASHEMVNIGDSLKNDVAGAKQAGIAAIWLNRENQRHDGGVKPDFEISSLLQLSVLFDK